jgi:hypothetical protein
MDGTVDANTDANTSEQAPPQRPPPPIKGNEYTEGDNSEGGGNKVAKTTEKPPHWTAYIEATCAVPLVLITATYTHYAHEQASAAITAANAAKTASDTAASTLQEMQKTSCLPGNNSKLSLGNWMPA